jgi:hypothetical protein
MATTATAGTRRRFIDSSFRLNTRRKALTSVIAIVLRSFPDHGADAGSGRASDQTPLQSTTQHGAKHGSAGPANQRALARSDSALRAIPLVVTVVRMPWVVVLSAVAALPDAVIKISIAPDILVSTVRVPAITTIPAIASIILIRAAAASVMVLAAVVSPLRQHRGTREQERNSEGSRSS